MGGREGMTLAREVAEQVNDDLRAKADIVICPPFINMEGVQFECEEAEIAVGGQDCSNEDDGAFTGQISAKMLHEASCEYVILGHSERRQHNDETDDLVCNKAKSALDNELTAVICVGETLAEREAGDAEAVVQRQLAGSVPDEATAETLVIAYEPVWAIGTGKTATPDDVAAMHAFIKAQLQKRFADGGKMRILYGGSVRPGNAAELFSVLNVHGALVGGASLKADDFVEIIRAA